VRRKEVVAVTVCVAIVILFVTACAGEPQKKPEKAPKEEPTIKLYMADQGEVKEIKMEEYVTGVVAGEMEPDWPVNALAAQAILARTFTMENMNAGRKFHGADASTNHEEFQAYEPSKINDKIKKAVEKTKGEVITYDGKYTRGWFSACCGGITAAASEGLTQKKGSTGYLKANAKDGCLEITTAENKHWKAEIPLDEVRTVLQEKTGKDPGNISQAKIAGKGPSGRAMKLDFGDATVDAMDFRLAVGADKMRSTLLSDFSVKGDKLVIEGKGFGHGVGLCQWGAKKMAQEDKSPEEIIKFYHKNIAVQKLWD